MIAMRLTPVIRITVGLVLLTISILLAGNLLGLTPDASRSELNARQRFCETLAVQLTLALNDDNVAMVQSIVDTVAGRDPAILSAALRMPDGSLLVTSPGHQQHWRPVNEGVSTPTHVQVPVFQGQTQWGVVEISFKPLRPKGMAGLLSNPFVQLLMFVAFIGFLVYYILMKKALKYLDPSAVIPGRVKAALDVLAEGVVLMDDRDRAVLVNDTFARKLGVPAKALLGKRMSQLQWTQPGTGTPIVHLPWSEAMRTRTNMTGIPMRLTTEKHGTRILMVNSAPILDEAGKPRGTLSTFDDVTRLEQKNTQLEELLQLLQKSQDKVTRQNEQLQVLASRDSLTKCLNRRALFQQMDNDFEQTRHSEKPLCCIMCDIDQFKKINDTHGHLAGDRVIREVAQVLKSLTRDNDSIGRYGGEEFCILLPNTSIAHAEELAERLRVRIAELDFDGARVTTSFGITSTEHGADDPKGLIRQADVALYRAKDSGRNCVVVWNAQLDAQKKTG